MPDAFVIQRRNWHRRAGACIVGRGLAPAEASGMEYTSFGKIAEQQQDGGSKPPPYDHRYRLCIFIEQKTPADLEKSAGAFYLFTAEQIYAV